MNRKAIGLAVACVALAVLIYVLAHLNEGQVAAQPELTSITTDVALGPPAIEPTLPAVPKAPEPAKPPDVSKSEISTNSARPLSDTPGAYVFTPSVEWRTFYMLTTLACGMGNPSVTQQQVNLTVEEFSLLVDHAKKILEEDRNFQIILQSSICNTRDTFHSLEEFGDAMNARARQVESNQELLGREARSRLPSALFSKIDASVRNQTARQLTRTDASKMLASANADLQTVIERACSAKF